jgi:hypothetical protein
VTTSAGTRIDGDVNHAVEVDIPSAGRVPCQRAPVPPPRDRSGDGPSERCAIPVLGLGTNGPTSGRPRLQSLDLSTRHAHAVMARLAAPRCCRSVVAFWRIGASGTYRLRPGAADRAGRSAIGQGYTQRATVVRSASVRLCEVPTQQPLDARCQAPVTNKVTFMSESVPHAVKLPELDDVTRYLRWVPLRRQVGESGHECATCYLALYIQLQRGEGDEKLDSGVLVCRADTADEARRSRCFRTP